MKTASSLLFIFIIPLTDGFQCYLCNGMQSSLQACDEKIVRAPCDTHAKGADRCGIFSFINGSTGIRVYGKSCVYQRYCEDKEHFCQKVSSKLGDAKECTIVCCTEEFCNFNNSGFREERKEDDDSEDCDWIDQASAPTRISVFLIAVCVLYAINMLK